ncbi:MAG TPA: carotenoid biosynthesis protein [Proteobacteria bacterium]|nr:carotenoid biosynthesis protein [Pseudomonadota bacterium]
MKYVRILIIGLFVFTLFAHIGYATIGIHSGYHFPSLSNTEIDLILYLSIIIGAQGQIWLSFGILIVALSLRVGKKWLLVFFLVYLTTLGIEVCGTVTGFPFGDYKFSALLGPKWFNLVPISIPISWFCISLSSYGISALIFAGEKQRWIRMFTGVLLILNIDLILDPALSHLLPVWEWFHSGPYYDIPAQNYAGWFLTSFTILTIYELMKVNKWINRISPWLFIALYGANVFAPLGIVLLGGLWIPGLLTTFLYLISLIFSLKALRANKVVYGEV